MLRHFLLATVLVYLVTCSANAQVQLRWKLDDGMKTTTTKTAKVAQILTLAGQEIETKSAQTSTSVATAGERDDDGNITVEVKIASLKSEMVLPGGVELKFDSEKETEPQGTAFDKLLDIFEAMSKNQWTMTFDKDGKVTEAKGSNKVLEQLDADLQKVVESQLDPEYIAETVNAVRDVIPSKPVRKGDVWTRSLTARLEAGQYLKFKTTYEYQGIVEQDDRTLDKITAAMTDVEYGTADDAPIKVTKSDLKIDSSNGTVLFDRERGLIVANQIKTRIKGDLTLNINGTELGGKLDLTFDSSEKIE